MIERKILIDAEEYERLPVKIAQELLEWAKKPYGCKLVSCETGQEITDVDLAVGSLHIPLEKALSLDGK